MDNKEKIDEIYNKLNKIAISLNVDYVSGTLYSISVLFSTLINSGEKTVFSIKDKIEISNSSEYKMVCKYFPEYDEGDILYLSLHLLGSRLKTTSMSIIQEDYSESYFLARGLVYEFSRIACVEFEEKQELIQALFTHLKASLYRYKYGIQLANPMLNEIKKEYSDLFEITKQACKYIEYKLKIPIPDSEVAYITLHFGSYLDYKMLYKKKIKIMIICPNGIGTGSMLKKEVSVLLPNAKVENSSFNIKEEELENYELIITTVTNPQYRKCKDILIVNPILTDNDRVMIMRKCMDFSDKEVNMLDSIIKIAKKYIKKDEMKLFKIDLVNQLKENRVIKIQPSFNSVQYGLIKFLKSDFIHIFKESMSWQNSIKILGDQLVRERLVKQEYINSIINSINKIGSYMFISSNIVLAHAKPSDGTIELGINVGIFHENIEFPNEKYAKIIFLISAIDQVSHLHILSDIVNIASDEKVVNRICSAVNKGEVLSVIEEKLN